MNKELIWVMELIKNAIPTGESETAQTEKQASINELKVVDAIGTTANIISKVNKRKRSIESNSLEAQPLYKTLSETVQQHDEYFQTCAKIDKARARMQLAVINADGHITRLYLSGLYLPEIPLDISVLQHLELLCIHNCQLVFIPVELANLSHIKVICFQNNKITFISKEIAQIPSLIELSVINNPVKNLPEEIVFQGLAAMRNYIESMESALETTYLYEAKLVFVGRGFAGKTSLVRKLVNPDYKLEKDIKTTEGIEIKYWDIKLPLEKSNTFRFNIWDFGGQEKYDATHQFFITERTVYVFVTEARQESNYLDFDYWLNVIQTFGNNSPVIVVQNKIDLRKKNLPTESYQQLFPNILCFVDVSCSDGYEHTILELIKQIKKAVGKLPQVGDKLPREWVDIRNELKAKKADYITYQDYVKLCFKHGLSQEKADFLSRYYHDLGVIVHYSKDPILKQLVVINPDWVVDGSYSVLDKRSIAENRGKFSESDLERIWDDPKYRKKHSELLALMKNYELCFEIGTTGMYIAPELLPSNPAQFTPINKKGKLTFIYHYKFMPAGIMTRFIVKLNKLIDAEKFWRQGVLLQYEGARALVIADDPNRNITIEIDGQSNKKELLAIIRKEFFEIHSDFKRKTQIYEYVPCNCSECRESLTPHQFKWETIKKYDRNKLEKIRCEQSLIEIGIKELVGDISDNDDGFSEDNIFLDQSVLESNDEKVKQLTQNNYFPLFIGLSWWGILVFTVVLFAFTKIERFYLITFLVVFMITFPMIIAFTLVDKKSLSEENFIIILKLAFAKIPGFQWITKNSNK